MYQYRVFTKTTELIGRVAVVLMLALGFLVSVEFLRLFMLLYRRAPWLGYGLIGVAAAVLAIVIIRGLIHRRDHRILRARGYAVNNRSSHARLKKHLLHLIHCIKRMTTHRLLTDDQAAALRQRAHDIQDILNHHPLNDDLHRSIDNAREQVIKPAFYYFDSIANKVTRAKIRAAIQDIYQPPFPVIPPLVVVYHQVTLVSEITDTYISRPSLREYIRVMIDVWKLMTKGDFLRYGQRLFSGINSNPYALARTGEDVGHALSITWLSHAIACATRLRCTTLHDWDINVAIEEMKEEVIPCLERTRDSLQPDVLPNLKARIRHYAPYGSDPDQFVDQISTALTKSVDSVVLTLSAKNRSASNKSAPVNPPDGSALFDIKPEIKHDHEAQMTEGGPATDTSAQGDTARPRRRRRRRRTNGFKGFISRLLRPGSRT